MHVPAQLGPAFPLSGHLSRSSLSMLVSSEAHVIGHWSDIGCALWRVVGRGRCIGRGSGSRGE